MSITMMTTGQRTYLTMAAVYPMRLWALIPKTEITPSTARNTPIPANLHKTRQIEILDEWVIAPSILLL